MKCDLNTSIACSAGLVLWSYGGTNSTVTNRSPNRSWTAWGHSLSQRSRVGLMPRRDRWARMSWYATRRVVPLQFLIGWGRMKLAECTCTMSTYLKPRLEVWGKGPVRSVESWPGLTAQMDTSGPVAEARESGVDSVIVWAVIGGVGRVD